MINNLGILFIGAHPDDIELSCAGTICYYAKKKKRDILLSFNERCI